MIDFATAREAMVDTQVRPSDVTRYAIIRTMLTVPRELYVPRALREVAYAETDLPLGEGRVMLAPRTFAKMLEAAHIGSEDVVLDLAPGLGYSTAVLSHLAAAVIGVEPDEGLARHGAETLLSQERDNAVLSHGDPADGDAEHGPYDIIFVNGGVERVPPTLPEQLKIGGRMVAIHMTGNVGQCRVTTRTENSNSARAFFDATAPVLAGFAREQSFVF